MAIVVASTLCRMHETILITSILSTVATLGIGAAVFIPLGRALARRIGGLAEQERRLLYSLQAELESTQARLDKSEEKVAFLEQLLQRPREHQRMPSAPVNSELGRIEE